MTLTPQEIDEVRKKIGFTPASSTSQAQENGAANVARRRQLAAEYDAEQQIRKPVDRSAEFRQEAGQDVQQTFGAVKETVAKTKEKIDKIAEASISGGESKITAFLKTAGVVAGGISRGLGDVVIGAVKFALPQSAEEALKSKIKSTIENGVVNAAKWDEVFGSPVETFIENYKNLPDKDKRTVEALLGGTQLAVDLATAGTTKKVVEFGAKKAEEAIVGGISKTGEAISEGAEAMRAGAQKAGQAVSKSKVVRGAKQIGTEIVERLPRAVDRLKDSSKEATERAVKIAQSEPAVATAFKSNLDSRFINTVAEADEPTRRAFKEVVDIAEETPKTLALKRQPSIVSGELASKQADLIYKEKKRVGKQIGDKIKELSKTEVINIDDSIKQMDDILGGQGIKINYTKKGAKLDFTGTNLTPPQRTKVQELYTLATEGGNKLSPNQIHGKDQLFSRLQREASVEKITNIMVETADGDKNIFGVFRDIFSKNLDNISPEMRALNKEYSDLIKITEDMEDTILKTPNLNIVKKADAAEFAKVNLRAIFGESNRSPAFDLIADQMDELARKLGYAEASPKEVAEFTQALRALYPESIPKTGFTGGIKMGVKDLVNKVLDVGAPNLADQRKALIGLLESYAP